MLIKSFVFYMVKYQKLMKLEEYGFWIVFWALLVSIIVQLAAGVGNGGQPLRVASADEEAVSARRAGKGDRLADPRTGSSYQCSHRGER